MAIRVSEEELAIILAAYDENSEEFQKLNAAINETQSEVAEMAAGERTAAQASAELGDELDGVAAAGAGAAGANRGLGISFTELNQAVELIGRGIAAGKQAYDEIVGSTLEYAEAVRDQSRALGTSAEETSKLIQIADDLNISQQTLEMAFRTAQEHGINPTIAGLKEAAAEYQSIIDPVERAQFAMDTFGQRAGLDMQRVLALTTDQIDEMAQSAEDAGLVLDEQAVHAAREAEIAFDDLGDSVEGLKLELAQEVIPILTDAAIATTDLITATRNLTEEQGLNRENFQEWSDAYERFWLGPIFGGAKQGLEDWVGGLFGLEAAQEAADEQTKSAADIMADYRRELGLAAEETEQFKLSNEELADIFDRDLAGKLTGILADSEAKRAEIGARITTAEQDLANKLVGITEDAEGRRLAVAERFAEQRLALDASYGERKKSLEAQIADAEKAEQVSTLQAELAELEERERRKGELNVSEKIRVETIQREIAELQKTTTKSRLEELRGELAALEEKHNAELAALEKKQRQELTLINKAEEDKTAAAERESEKRITQFEAERDKLQQAVQDAYWDAWLPALEAVAEGHSELEGVIDDLLVSQGQLEGQMTAWLQQLPGQFQAAFGAFGANPDVFRSLIGSIGAGAPGGGNVFPFVYAPNIIAGDPAQIARDLQPALDQWWSSTARNRINP